MQKDKTHQNTRWSRKGKTTVKQLWSPKRHDLTPVSKRDHNRCWGHTWKQHENTRTIDWDDCEPKRMCGDILNKMSKEHNLERKMTFEHWRRGNSKHVGIQGWMSAKSSTMEASIEVKPPNSIGLHECAGLKICKSINSSTHIQHLRFCCYLWCRNAVLHAMSHCVCRWKLLT